MQTEPTREFPRWRLPDRSRVHSQPIDFPRGVPGLAVGAPRVVAGAGSAGKPEGPAGGGSHLHPFLGQAPAHPLDTQLEAPHARGQGRGEGAPDLPALVTIISVPS